MPRNRCEGGWEKGLQKQWLHSNYSHKQNLLFHNLKVPARTAQTLRNAEHQVGKALKTLGFKKEKALLVYTFYHNKLAHIIHMQTLSVNFVWFNENIFLSLPHFNITFNKSINVKSSRWSHLIPPSLKRNKVAWLTTFGYKLSNPSRPLCVCG